MGSYKTLWYMLLVVLVIWVLIFAGKMVAYTLSIENGIIEDPRTEEKE